MKLHLSKFAKTNKEVLLLFDPVEDTSPVTKADTCQFELLSDPSTDRAAKY